MRLSIENVFVPVSCDDGCIGAGASASAERVTCVRSKEWASLSHLPAVWGQGRRHPSEGHGSP